MNYDSYEPWHTKTTWFRVLSDRTREICSNINLFQKQLTHIKMVMPWHGYPCYVRNKIIKRLRNRKNTKNKNTFEKQDIS